jgi:hypothetical protein
MAVLIFFALIVWVLYALREEPTVEQARKHITGEN